MSDLRTNRIRTATLALAALAALLVGGRDPAAEPSPEGLASLIEGYAHAVETNNRELALWYVHPGSPSRSAIDAKLRSQLASYLERARTSHLEPMRRADGTTAAKVEQEVVRVSGLKFMRATRRSIYHFREFGGSWRIWEIEELSSH